MSIRHVSVVLTGARLLVKGGSARLDSQTPGAARGVVGRVADALGGCDRAALRTLTIDIVHGRVLPLAEVRQHQARQIESARALCAAVDAGNLTMRGCRVETTVDR